MGIRFMIIIKNCYEINLQIVIPETVVHILKILMKITTIMVSHIHNYQPNILIITYNYTQHTHITT